MAILNTKLKSQKVLGHFHERHNSDLRLKSETSKLKIKIQIFDVFFLHPGSDPDHSHNLRGPMVDHDLVHDHLSHLFCEDQTSSICYSHPPLVDVC